MKYDYTNLSAFFIYGEGKAELWETSFGEYFYPYIPDTYIDVDINVQLPDSLSLLCSYPLESRYILAQSIALAFIQKDAYSHTVAYVPEKVEIYQVSGMQCDEKRYRELLELTKAGISYFSKIYGMTISPDKEIYIHSRHTCSMMVKDSATDTISGSYLRRRKNFQLTRTFIRLCMK